MTGTLRVAVATDGTLLPRWQARAIEAAAAVEGVEIIQWLRASDVTGSGGPRGTRGALAVVPAPVPIAVLEDGSGTVTRDADVLLDLTRHGVDGTTAAGVETWRFGWGPGRSRDAVRVLLADVVAARGTSLVTLLREPDGEIIRQGALQTLHWSRRAHLDGTLFGTAGWPSLALRSRLMGRGGESALPAAVGAQPRRALADAAGTADDHSGLGGALALDRWPRPLLSTAAFGRQLLEMARPLMRHEDWNIGVIRAPIECLLEPGAVETALWLPTRPGRFAADPFGVEWEGVLHVLFEDYDQRRGRAVISHVAVSGGNPVSDPEPVFDPGVHTSYPYLVEHRGGLWMLPETAGARELVLYEATEFPRRWTRATTLIRGLAVSDATIIEHDGRWWMFATRNDHGVNNDLFVWHAESLTGPWVPHAANPVKTDARSCRPAGTPFVKDGILYRPGQDSSRTYGGRVVINRVEVLTPTDFSERPVAAVEPSPSSEYPAGLHTVAAAGGNTLIDGKAIRFVPEALAFAVGRKLSGSRRSKAGAD
jgi:hypothetical protein